MVRCNSTECNSIERKSVERPNIYPNLNTTSLNEISLSDQQHFRLNKINEIKDYKSSIVLSTTSGSISIASFAAIIGTPVGLASASVSLTFLLSTGIVKSC